MGGPYPETEQGPSRMLLERSVLSLTQNNIFPILPSWEKDWKSQIEIARPFELIKTGDESRDIEENTRRLIEMVFAPHIKRNYFAWLRLLWTDLAPMDAEKTQKVA